MSQDGIEVFATLVNHCCETDDFRAGADNDKEFQLPVILKMDVAIVEFRCFVHYFCTLSKYVSGL